MQEQEHKMHHQHGDELEAKEIRFKNELGAKLDENNNSIKHHHHVEEWGYEIGPSGPSEWGKRFPKALNGKHQSPIDIKTNACKYDERLAKNPLTFTYDKECFHELKNTGHSFQVSGLATANSSK